MGREMSTQEDNIETDAAETAQNADGAELPAENSGVAATEDSKTGESGDKNDDSTGAGGETSDPAGNTGTEGKILSGEAGENQKIAELGAKSADLEAQLADSRDQLLRKAADFENFRKRMHQDKQNAIDFANQQLLLDIIPIIDDFERAIQSAETSAELTGLPAGKAVLDGITMIEKRLVDQLEKKWQLKRFNSAGEPFDPNRHEAMTMEKSPDIEEPVVQEEFSKGYMLKDRVIRAAQVKVLMPEGEGRE
jgi:molecular chaperone GrpE